MNKICLVLLVLGLSGCATNQHFDCKQSNGVRCQSLSEIDRRVSTGEIGKPNKKSNQKNQSNSIYLSEISDENKVNKASSLRTKEEVAEIWIAAYQTKEGTYHQANSVHTVLKPSKWIHATKEIGIE